MREGGEDQLRVREISLLGRGEGDGAAEWERERFALLGVGRGEGEVERGMRGDECAELAAGVPRGPEDPDWNFMHTLNIFMPFGWVNSGFGVCRVGCAVSRVRPVPCSVCPAPVVDSRERTWRVV